MADDDKTASSNPLGDDNTAAPTEGREDAMTRRWRVAGSQEAEEEAKKKAGYHGLVTRVASSFTPMAIRWFWPDRFAIGKLGLIGGMPDKGKGLIVCSMVASATARVPLPCGEGVAPQGDVILLSAEDDTEDTVVPRLMAAGANRDRVHIVRMMRSFGRDRTFSMVSDLPELKRKMEEIGNVVLVIIDPMSAHVGVGEVNTNMTTDVRGFLKPLTDLAAEKGV
jgi:hypothetical protein